MFLPVNSLFYEIRYQHSYQILEKPPFQAVFLRFRCAGIGIPPTVRIVVHRTCYDGTIPERQVRFMFYYSKRSHRKIVHTKSCFLVRGFDAASAIRGYHNQHICFRSLPEYFTYITSHDAYRMHHPQARDPQCAGAHRFAGRQLRRAPGGLRQRDFWIENTGSFVYNFCKAR